MFENFENATKVVEIANHALKVNEGKPIDATCQLLAAAFLIAAQNCESPGLAYQACVEGMKAGVLSIGVEIPS